jgi:hypothetical protein
MNSMIGTLKCLDQSEDVVTISRFLKFPLWQMPPEIHALVQNADNINAVACHAIEQKVRPNAVL